jgi:uncharacterized protein (UPF0335 family)
LTRRAGGRIEGLDLVFPRWTGPMNKPEMISPESVEVNGGHLRAFIERIERLEEEKRTIADDIKEVYAEAKGNGFDVKIMRKVISLRRMDRDKRIEEETVLDLYLQALGEL